jgi:hypothetical protein
VRLTEHVLGQDARRFLALRARPLQASKLDLHAQLLDLALELVAIRRVIVVAAEQRGPRKGSSSSSRGFK